MVAKMSMKLQHTTVRGIYPFFRHYSSRITARNNRKILGNLTELENVKWISTSMYQQSDKSHSNVVFRPLDVLRGCTNVAAQYHCQATQHAPSTA